MHTEPGLLQRQEGNGLVHSPCQNKCCRRRGGIAKGLVEKVGASGYVVGIDLVPMDPIKGAELICGDFYDPEVIETLKETLKDPVNVVLTDMAASSTGHAQTDHLRIMALAEEAFTFAMEVLEEDGAFVAKVLRGGTEKELLASLKQHFRKVVHFKPPSSRTDSAEMYVVAMGFHQ